MHVRIDTDARTAPERATAAAVLRAAAELLEQGGSAPPPAAGTGPASQPDPDRETGLSPAAID